MGVWNSANALNVTLSGSGCRVFSKRKNLIVSLPNIYLKYFCVIWLRIQDFIYLEMRKRKIVLMIWSILIPLILYKNANENLHYKAALAYHGTKENPLVLNNAKKETFEIVSLSVVLSFMYLIMRIIRNRTIQKRLSKRKGPDHVMHSFSFSLILFRVIGCKNDS